MKKRTVSQVEYALQLLIHMMTHAKSIFLKYSSNRHSSRWGGGGGGGFLRQWLPTRHARATLKINSGIVPQGMPTITKSMYMSMQLYIAV